MSFPSVVGGSANMFFKIFSLLNFTYLTTIISVMPFQLQTNPFVVPTTDGKLIEEHVGGATDGNHYTLTVLFAGKDSFRSSHGATHHANFSAYPQIGAGFGEDLVVQRIAQSLDLRLW